MIVNRIVMTEGNRLSFSFSHTVNGEPITLSPGEKYYIAVAPEDNYENRSFVGMWDGGDFSMPNGLTEGSYAFEIGIEHSNRREVILPALDENRRILNQIIVLKRIYDL